MLVFGLCSSSYAIAKRAREDLRHYPGNASQLYYRTKRNWRFPIDAMKQSDADLDQAVFFLLYSVFFFSPAWKMVMSSVWWSIIINTISLQCFAQKRLSIGIYRTLLGPVFTFYLSTVISSPYFGDLSFCPIQASSPTLLPGRVVTAPFVLHEPLPCSAPFYSTFKSDICTPHHHFLLFKAFSVKSLLIEQKQES